MSREKKRQMIWHQVDDSEAIARHLEKMARKGWQLEKVDNLFYTYCKSEPAEVRYTVTFFPDASYFDPGLIEGQETYAEYCAAAGWELAASYGPIQYFRTANPSPPPIETDETIKLQTIRRTMRKSFIPSYAVMLLLPIIILVRLRYDTISIFYSNLQLSLNMLMFGTLIFSIGMLADYLIWLLRSQYAVNRGGTCKKPHTRFRLLLNAVMMLICILAVIGYMMNDSWIRNITVIYGAIYLGLIILSRWVLRKLKSSNTERGAARMAYFTFAIIAGLVVGISTPFLFIHLSNAGILHTRREPAETYTYISPDTSFRYPQSVYYDDLPITLEDLGYTITPDDHCSYEEETDRSLLASHSRYMQEALNFNSALPDLFYQTYDSPFPYILEKTWEELIASDTARYEPEIIKKLDPAPWGALEAYQPEGLTTYYLLYPTRVVTMHLSKEVPPQQLDAIAEALRP